MLIVYACGVSDDADGAVDLQGRVVPHATFAWDSRLKGRCTHKSDSTLIGKERQLVALNEAITYVLEFEYRRGECRLASHLKLIGSLALAHLGMDDTSLADAQISSDGDGSHQIGALACSKRAILLHRYRRHLAIAGQRASLLYGDGAAGCFGRCVASQHTSLIDIEFALAVSRECECSLAIFV